jgi:hypothetical protein
MSDDPEAALAAAVTRTGPAAALQALGHAASWAARAVPAVTDDVTAFECVIALDQALAHLAGLLRSVPPLVRLASPGQPVSDRLAAADAELGRQRAELAAEHAKLTAARNLEQRAGALQAERDQLQQRIGQLEQASLIERHLPGLRARQAELDAAVSSAAEADGAEAVTRLAAAARHVLSLTDEQKALIQAGNDQLVTGLAAATESLTREQARQDELTAQLTALEQQAGQLAEQRRQGLPGLRARQEADSALAAGLTAGGLPSGEGVASRVGAELATIEQRISAAEDLLRPLLKQHAQAYEEARKITGWTGG